MDQRKNKKNMSRTAGHTILDALQSETPTQGQASTPIDDTALNTTTVDTLSFRDYFSESNGGTILADDQWQYFDVTNLLDPDKSGTLNNKKRVLISRDVLKPLTARGETDRRFSSFYRLVLGISAESVLAKRCYRSDTFRYPVERTGKGDTVSINNVNVSITERSDAFIIKPSTSGKLVTQPKPFELRPL